MRPRQSHPARCLRSRRDSIFSTYLAAFADFPALAQRLLTVLESLPEAVQRDFLDDPRFSVAVDNYKPGQGWTLWMPTPSVTGESSRCVVLRTKLADCAEAFAHYVIAHELAHAFLRNGSWGEYTDVEEAADALAASWGYCRPV
jgi:hypothetical protein